MPSSETNNTRSNIGLPAHQGKRYLPQPRGPHSVGFVDVMTSGKPGVGSFVRFLYPTTDQCLNEHSKWPLWKNDDYLVGTLSFIKAMGERWPSWAPRSEYLGIDYMGFISPFIPKYGFPTLYRLFNGAVYVPIIERGSPDTSKQWPLIVFSHGLGCARSSYSRICYDLASYGFVVAATEHRDGTACYSYYMDDMGVKKPVYHERVTRNEDEYNFRNQQLKQRRTEVSNALDLIENIKEANEMPQNILFQGNDNLLKDVIAMTDNSKPVISGHSFGGATTILSLIEDPRFHLGVALDVWGFPLKNVEMSNKINKPLLVINTDLFRSYENLQKLSELRPLDQKEMHKQFYYIKGSVHQNHVDIAFVVSLGIAKKILGLHSETCPEKVLDLNNKKMVQFIWTHLQMSQDEEVNEDIRKQEELLINLFDKIEDLK